MSAGERKYFDTKLDRWMAANGVKPAHLARKAHHSRQHLLRIRKAEMEPTRRLIKELVLACRKLTAKPVAASNLFDLGD